VNVKPHLEQCQEISNTTIYNCKSEKLNRISWKGKLLNKILEVSHGTQCHISKRTKNENLSETTVSLLCLCLSLSLSLSLSSIIITITVPCLYFSWWIHSYCLSDHMAENRSLQMSVSVALILCHFTGSELMVSWSCLWILSWESLTWLPSWLDVHSWANEWIQLWMGNCPPSKLWMEIIY
jgi:hypothetical protein